MRPAHIDRGLLYEASSITPITTKILTINYLLLTSYSLHVLYIYEYLSRQVSVSVLFFIYLKYMHFKDSKCHHRIYYEELIFEENIIQWTDSLKTDEFNYHNTIVLFLVILSYQGTCLWDAGQNLWKYLNLGILFKFSG